MWIEPDLLWIVAHESIFIDRDSAGIAMSVDGITGGFDVVKELLIGYHVNC
jgi:hypothetical protein